MVSCPTLYIDGDTMPDTWRAKGLDIFGLRDGLRFEKLVRKQVWTPSTMPLSPFSPPGIPASRTSLWER